MIDIECVALVARACEGKEGVGGVAFATPEFYLYGLNDTP